MSTLTVWAYNVKFGDALLVRVPDRDPATGRETMRHILVDVGNVQAGDGGDDAVFLPVISDIRRRLRGRPIDLYVMTHEHLDHVQGLYYASTVWGLELDVDYAWLTASADPQYYSRHPAARTRIEAVRSYFLEAERQLAAVNATHAAGLLAVMANNHPRRTSACVDYLRRLARVRTTFVHRSRRLRPGTHHPFQEAQFRILAPEEDTAQYYGRFRPSPLRAAGTADLGPTGPATDVQAPPGVDVVAFSHLMQTWRDSISSNILAIDKAANNTSVVFELRWRGWRLLFAGDAEQRSWLTMRDRLEPVDFLKVAHHGSSNATPPDSILELLFPQDRTDRRARTSLVSTCAGTYPGVPDDSTLKRLQGRCDRVLSTAAVPDGGAVRIVLRAGRNEH
jgi:beta-lactamase superfamily II metal-dependent hydrolase